ncbi:hypothetical protein [Sphingobacterium sp.]|uniref:hypothetical protein n=1 Tax=Sphingobacterium sp. TaxID=341027 RepID=UPI00289BB8D4|nr:hypothetical protein [Sphingobacterium sp.]
MKYLNKIIELVNPVTTRPYKGGVELRGLNLDTAKDEIQSVIQANGWPVEIFDVDVRLKSVSIREK